MTQGAKAFIFTVGAKTFERANDVENLKYATETQNNPYISEDDADDLFGCVAEYISGSGNAVCLTGNMDSRADEVLSMLQEG